MVHELNFQALTDRLPPQNLDAEEAILGGILLDPEAITRVADILRPEAFYLTAHREIYRAALVLQGQGIATDLMSVTAWLRDHGHLDKVGGQSKLVQLIDRTVSSVNIDQYAKLVMEKYMRRKLIHVGGEISQLGYNTSVDLEELLDQAEQQVFGITQDRPQQGLVATSDILTHTFNDIESRSLGMVLPGLSCGFYDLDAMTQGFQRSDLIIVAGRPSMGKTSFTMNVARNIAAYHKLPVAIFSLEMSKEQLVQRLLASEVRIESGRLRAGRISQQEWEPLGHAISSLSQLPLFIDDTPNISITEIRSKTRRLQAEQGGALGLVLLDYLQLMDGGSDNRVQELSKITRSLKALARELNVPVLALSQLSRSVESRTNKRPMMSDLRECVTGETLVVLSNGQRVPIRDLVGKTPEVVSMDTSGKLVHAQADLVWSVGKKPVFKIQLASGRTIRATHNHRLYGLDGWQEVQDLRPGSRLAVARYLPEPNQPADNWPEARLALLGQINRVSAFGPRVEPANALKQALNGIVPNPNRDTLPKEIFALVKTEMKSQGISQRAMAGLRGTAYGGSSHFRFAPSRATMTHYAELLDSAQLREMAASDLFWDEICSIEPDGEEEVYDLTVPETASWLADGIVSHNSGAIEQDADLIMMLYRDEYYNPDTPDRGIAEVILTKHRNGPTGTVKLLFESQFTQFRNLASPSRG